MGLFGKKKENGCCCQSSCAAGKSGTGAVKVLGSGCPNCMALEKSARQALEDLGMDTDIDHVTDFAQIAAYGVMSTPALVVDGKVVSSGKVLSREQARELIRQAREEH